MPEILSKCCGAWAIRPSLRMLENGNDYHTCNLCGKKCEIEEKKTATTKYSYKVIQFHPEDKKLVAIELNNGWKLHGPPSFIEGEFGVRCYQAVIKKEQS